MEQVHLTSKPAAALIWLVENRGRTVSKQELLEHVWGGHLNANVVEQAIRQIRDALEDDKASPRFIRTVPGEGYCFIAPVEDAGGEEPRKRGPRTIGRRGWLVGGAAAAAIVSASGIARVLMSGGLGPVRAGLNGNTLCLWDAAGAPIWKHVFAEPFGTRRDAGWPAPQRRAQIVDLGRGPSVVCAVAFGQNDDGPERHELCCFSMRGRLLWRRSIGFHMVFGGERFDGPWRLTDMVAAPGLGRSELYVSGAHWMWRPGFVARVDADGNATLRFANAGNIHALHCGVDDSGGYLLAGGVNNEYNAASVAVLRDGQPASRSPQTRGSRFDPVSGPDGDPARYFLLPPSEMNLAMGQPYNWVVGISRGDGLTSVTTWEGSDSEGGTPTAIYRFNDKVEPADVTFNSTWAGFHRRLQSGGRLDHSLADCRFLKRRVPVRRWDRTGWTTIEVPVAESIAPGAYHARAETGIKA